MKKPNGEFDPADRSWLRKTFFWFVPVVTILIAGPVALCGGGIWIAWNTFSPPYVAALKITQENQSVVKQLGSPIRGGANVKVTNYSVKEGNGDCSISFEITGPNGRARVFAYMVCVDEVWSAHDLRVEFADGAILQIIEAPQREPDNPVT